MRTAQQERPCLRPVDAIPDPAGGRIVIRDPSQLASGILVVGRAELLLLSLLDGERTPVEIQAEFARRSGRLLLSHELEELLEQLDTAGYLAGPGFEAHYSRLEAEYRALHFRPLREAKDAGEAAALALELDGALDEAAGRSAYAPPGGQLVALVTPHLDFPRGRPCYADGYLALRREMSAGEPPRRAVVLGTNHFGRSRSIVATGKDFQTPWGVLPTDREFLERLEFACGGSLMPHEMDHLREHSIELQAIWLRHLLGPDLRIVPFLCPDPTGPRGTAPGDTEGVDLRVFAQALGQLLREDPAPTLLIASADLSHTGAYFGDRLDLDDGFLEHVARTDERGLAFVESTDPEALREHMTGTRNPTRWCSTGCLYAMMTAIGPSARAQRLRYHQAVTPELENCVTCAAAAFYV